MNDVLSNLSPYERAMAAVNYEEYTEMGYFSLETLVLHLAKDVMNLTKKLDEK